MSGACHYQISSHNNCSESQSIASKNRNNRFDIVKKLDAMLSINLTFEILYMESSRFTKHARLYDPGAPPINKIKRKVQRLSNVQEETIFQDRENNKFVETYPNGMKRSTFMARLKNSTNLKYRDDAKYAMIMEYVLELDDGTGLKQSGEDLLP
ncbi:hypothetical protein RhiirC2_795279 [Rhizophagus irregularis]|uniref:Uncharacterized protein n=1 Tax=Rhizophagus irregularis TaxID=588596 RepID=A0A2N1MBV5_9GLOM|nr:hypothetical protein RhiirC2_795279 [Rhizophagus irregularis]